LSYAPEDSTFT